MDLIFDHGSTVNVCCRHEAFTSMDPTKTQLSWFNNFKLEVAQGMATLMLYDSVRKHTMPLMMHMKHSPYGVSILSHARLVNDHGFKGQLSKDQSTFQYRNQHMCIQFKVQADELFHATAGIGPPAEHPTRTLATRATVDERAAQHNKLRKWHNRLAHANMDTIKTMAKHEMVTDMTLDKGDFGAKATCSACLQGKMKRMSYKSTHPRRTTKPMHKLIADIGFMGKTMTTENATCYLGAVDEATRMVFVKLLARKGDATDALIDLINNLNAKHPRHKIGVISTDDDKMFHNKAVAERCRIGMDQQVTHPYCPEEVCLAENLNCVLLNKTRAVLQASGLPDELWGECIKYVVYTMNRTASKALDNMTPLQALTGIKPSVKHLKPFGCLVYTHVAKAYRLGNKLAPRGVPCLFMSYDGDEQRGYRVLNLLTGKFETAREGRFVEDKTVDASYVTRALDIGHRRATQH